jgi:predicted TIM-barrel fold metal-dependent hydrolase
MTVLSAVPASPDEQPLPADRAALTVDTVRHLSAGTSRCVMHAFAMPNRGAYGPVGKSLRIKPQYMGQEFELMQRNVELYGDRIRGWKIYTAWGDIPGVSGWFIDDSIGLAFLEQVRKIGNRYGTPKVVAVHKGFALPGFDQRAASPRDVGPAARQYPDVTIVVYHSGYNSETVGPYPGDANVASAGLTVDALIKSLRENHWDATRFVPAGLAHGNVPNVFAEIGSTWRSVMHDPDQAAHLLGKLITYVGPARVAWGTDSLWYGSPQPQIVALRAFQFSDRAKTLYNLPYGLDGDVVDPRRKALDAASYLSPHPNVANWPVDKQAHPERTIRNAIFGRNAAPVYRVDPSAMRKAMSCDAVQKVRDAYYLNQLTPKHAAPLSSNMVHGPRTRRDMLNYLRHGRLPT